MTLIVEDGSGILYANSYAGLSYAHAYLHRRLRNTSWDAATVQAREAALVAATDYIDKRFGSRFSGIKLYLELDVFAENFLQFASQPQNNQTLTIGSVTYTFKNVVSVTNDILIGASITATITNFLAAVATHPDVNAEAAGADSVIVTHKLAGEQAEVLTSTDGPTRLSWDYAQLVLPSSGEQPLEWPRDYVYSRAGIALTGIPEKLRQATVEYASRAITAGLMPDPVVSDTGQDIRRKFEKVGPIEEETVYSTQVREVFKRFPEADKLLAELIIGSGGVTR
jgi:hypothetical protein